MEANCAFCKAKITLDGDFAPRTCTDVDTTKNCRQQLRDQHRFRAEQAGRRIGKCEYEDCLHEWVMRSKNVNYCPKCMRRPLKLLQSARERKEQERQAPKEMILCHHCGKKTQVGITFCRACRKPRPTQLYRYGLTVANWSKFVQWVNGAETDDTTIQAMRELLTVMAESDPEVRTALALGAYRKSRTNEPEPELAPVDDEPEEVELGVSEALAELNMILR